MRYLPGFINETHETVVPTAVIISFRGEMHADPHVTLYTVSSKTSAKLGESKSAVN
jgi:hypothetical protein